MPEESPIPEHLAELLQRWEQDPTPQLSLRLAEEYRRLDRRREAVPILTRALEDHPTHVAAQVALGRFRLELGEYEEAMRILERVVDHDPTHLVASKLLVSLYTETGRLKQARDRLDLYKLLNERDPEIESLEERLSAGGRGGRPTHGEVETEVLSQVQVPDDNGPFSGLWEGIGQSASWESIAAEGIFSVSKPSAVVEPTPSRLETPPAAATVTLANLYLQQGHLDDAEQAFREVLHQEPSNQLALTGLAEIQQLRGGGRVGEEPVAETRGEPGDLPGRKIAALRDYLERLRTASRQG